MPARRQRNVRVIVLLLLVVCAVSASRVTAAAEPACTRHCPANCPMHAKRARCHCGAAASRAERRVPREPGLYCTSCGQDPDSALTLEQPALLPQLAQAERVPSHLNGGVSLPGRCLDAHVDPPLRPPTRLLVVMR